MFWRKRCPFCQHRPALTQLPTNTVNGPLYSCHSCTSVFSVTPSGHFDVVPTAAMTADPTTCRPTVINPPTFLSTTTTTTTLLCAQCNANQTILLHLINNAPEDLLEGDDMERWEEWRRGVEARYPLCAACRFAVAERLKQVAFRVRCAKMRVARGREQSGGGRVGVFVLAVVEFLSFFGLMAVDRRMVFSVECRLVFLVLYSLFMSLLSRNIILTTVASVCKYYTDGEYQLVIVSIVYITITFIIRSFTSKPLVKIVNNPQQSTSDMKENIHQQPNHNSFASLSLSNTPLRHNTTHNPFQLKQTKPQHYSAVKLRPTRLDHGGQSSGLEDLFSSTIRLTDATANTHSTTGGNDTLKQSILSLLLFTCRLYLFMDREQPALVLMLFCVAFYLRPFWQDRLGWPVKACHVLMTFVRLSWLALMVSENYDALVVPVWVGLAFDGLLLLLR